MHLLLPAAASLLYVAAALFLKQAAMSGIDIWRTGFVCNGATALLFLLLWPLGGEIPSPAHFHQPALVAVLFVGGQFLTFLALKTGDVSVATPVMGSKVVLVALFTTLLGAGQVPLPLWLAAMLSAVGIAFLNRRADGAVRRIGRTISLALAAAVCYAMFDVLVMSWSPGWGAGRFLPITMLISGLLSLAFLPFSKRPAVVVPASGKRALLAGGFFIALQAMFLVTGLAVFGDATAMNVIYSTRGLWSVLAVWWLGHWFANTERQQGGAIFRGRLIGAACLCGSVALVFA
jgi:drug/metabolite transporter (DMT)-like permease